MALPASGTITAQMIENEFGGAHPISLNEYYRGGARVPNTPTNASVPTSGTISYNDFHGASALTALTASASGNAFADSSFAGTLTTNTVTVTPSGGLAPYTYAWTRISGDTSTTCNSPSSASTNWSATVGAVNPDRNSTWRCRVTDSASQIFDVNVSVSISYTGGA